MKKTILSLTLVLALLLSLCVPALTEADTAETTEEDVTAVLKELNEVEGHDLLSLQHR